MKSFPWTEVRDSTGATDNDYLLAHYAHTPMVQLVRILDRTDTAIAKQARKIGVRQRPPNTMREEILAAASKIEGMRAGPLGKHSADAVWRLANKMAQAGELYKAEVSYRHVRYFTDPKHADIARKRQQVTIVKPVHISRSKTGWGPDDPPYYDPSRPPKVTKYKTPPQALKTNTHSVY
jgi:hypothetical protein